MEDNKTSLTREEVLARSRKENACQDEREHQVTVTANTYSMIGLIAVFLLLAAARLGWMGGRLYDLLAMVCGALGAGALYRWRQLHKRSDLVVCLCYALCTVVWLGLYFWRG